MQIRARVHCHFSRGVEVVFIDFGDEGLHFDDWGLDVEAAFGFGEVADAGDHLIEIAACTVCRVCFLIVAIKRNNHLVQA